MATIAYCMFPLSSCLKCLGELNADNPSRETVLTACGLTSPFTA